MPKTAPILDLLYSLIMFYLISDFGLARTVDKEIYVMSSNTNIPVKCMDKIFYLNRNARFQNYRN